MSGVLSGHSGRDTGRISKKEGRAPYLSRIYWVSLFAEALELVNQGTAADAEGLGRLRPVEVVLAQRLEDGLTFDFRQALGILGFDRRGRFGHSADFRRQVFGQDEFAHGKECS